MSRTPNKTRGLRAALICLAVAAVFALAIAVYAGGYSRADADAKAALKQASVLDGVYSFGDERCDIGLIFYPGGRVEYTAYAPLAREISDAAGILCAVPEMPLNLAVLDSDAAEAVMALYPDVDIWYVGGHSLGGAMAAAYAAQNPDGAEGVILLAAYSTKPLAAPTLSIYGEKDTVLNREKYDEYLANLPSDFTELVIAGGNHAQFGCYGVQKGDSAASITAATQRGAAADAIAEFINGSAE